MNERNGRQDRIPDDRSDMLQVAHAVEYERKNATETGKAKSQGENKVGARCGQKNEERDTDIKTAQRSANFSQPEVPPAWRSNRSSP